MQFRPVTLAAILALGILSTGATPAAAQTAPAMPQPSPHARVEQQVGVTDFSVEYYSPGVKGRKIWGALVPFDQVWRTGANQATKLVASNDFKLAGKAVPAGTYAVYTIPGKSSWTVILSTDVNAWGAYSYNAKNDVARVQVKPQTLPAPRERMTFLFSDTTDGGTNLDLEWEKLRIRMPIEVETRAQVMAGIDKSLAEAWRPHFVSARYLLENEGDLKKALEYVNTSIAIKPTWWNQWVKAQILAKSGDKKGAVASGQEALQLGKGDQTFERFFKPQVEKAIGSWK